MTEFVSRHRPLTTVLEIGSDLRDGHVPMEVEAITGDVVIVSCLDCDARGSTYYSLPGDGTACLEEGSLPCTSCGGTIKPEWRWGTGAIQIRLTADPQLIPCPSDTDGDGGCWARDCETEHQRWRLSGEVLSFVPNGS